jgi:sugar O-acyltransferase (sialic acid O-acetyltransferase NeuD family)
MMMKKNNKKVLIYGASDFGKILRNLIRYCDYEFLGFISDLHKGEEIIGDFDKVESQINKNKIEIIIGVGYSDLQNRWSLYQRVKESGFRIASVIHPNAYICNSAKLDEGVIVMAGTNIDFNAKIGSISVLWPGTVISHDSKIGSNCFFSPNSTLCGFSTVGNNCFIGANAVIVDHTEVKENSFIKANSLVK